MAGFTYYAPTKVVFGKDTELQAGKLVKEFGGTKVLVHYGSERVVQSGLLGKVCDSLKAEGIDYVTLGGVVANPRISKVREGIVLGRKEKVDFILAVGGGSVMDSSKAIGYGMTLPEGVDVWDLYIKKVVAPSIVPVGVVVTIAATGSEMSNSSVLSNDDTQQKLSYNTDLGRPRFAIMNPELTKTLPDYQTSSGCADIMMHTIERYLVNGDTMEITDSIAEAVLRTIIAQTLILVRDPQNEQARAEVLWTGSLSHNGMTQCGRNGTDFVCHVLEHELGALYNVAHGAGLCAVWGTWARYVYKNCLHRFVRLARNVMGVTCEGTDEEIALKGIEAMEDWFRAIHMPTCLSELGVCPTEEEMKLMASKVAWATGGKKGMAKELYEADFLEIYRLANH